MNNNDYTFIYKGEKIPLKAIGQISENEVVREFNSLIEELNLKYSFNKLFHMNEDEWSRYPIEMIYKEEKTLLKQFVLENKEISKNLPHISEINGLEAKNKITLRQNNENEELISICTETFRLFQDVYNTFALARFSLLNGFQKLHLYSEITWDSGATGQYWIRTSYLNNAIIWYNSCYDILLQTLWTGKQYFISRNKSSINDLYKDYDNVLRSCNEKNIPDISCYKKEIEGWNLFTPIRDKANKLKHRNSLRYKEFTDHNNIWYNYRSYDLMKTSSNTDIESVISELINYHNTFILLVNKVKKSIFDELKEKYQISLTV